VSARGTISRATIQAAEELLNLCSRLEEDGHDPDVVIAALLSVAMNRRGKRHGQEAIAPWLERAVDFLRATTPAPLSGIR
jgi:hypothetical protein